MPDHTPLPDPPCGAISPDGDPCLSDSTVIVAAEWPTGYSAAVWRCISHIGESVEAVVQLNPGAVVTVTPLATIGDPDEPSPDSPPRDQPPLRLVH
jgi:hypothetical protein